MKNIHFLGSTLTSVSLKGLLFLDERFWLFCSKQQSFLNTPSTSVSPGGLRLESTSMSQVLVDVVIDARQLHT